jgi:uncharacterized protein (DUF1810 family)
MAQEARDSLLRFVTAQDPVFDQVSAELDAGFKQTHWMWFVFPQLNGLGASSMAMRYAISDLNEATAYLAHPVLGDRLRLCIQKLLTLKGKTANHIFGNVDTIKFKSCLTLFAIAAETDADSALFESALKKYFAGTRDTKTLDLLGIKPES